jgi:LemA protein
MKRITFVSAIATLAVICFSVLFFASENCDTCFSAPVMAVKVLISGLIIIIGGIYFTRQFLRTEKIIFEIESQPLLETDEATEGVPFAGEGVIGAEKEKILTSPYTKTPCVYFHSIKEKYTRQGKSSRWEVVENIASFIPFYIKDKRGRLKINLANLDDDFSGYSIPLSSERTPNPKNSEIDCQAVLKKAPFYKKERLFFPFLSRTIKYRRSEFILKPGIKVFVYGMVSRKDKQLVLEESQRCPLIISQKSRDLYVKEFYTGEKLVYLVHFLVALGYTMILLAISYLLKIKTSNLLLLLFAGNGIILGSIVFSVYNRIITLKNRALNSLSNIDIELKRRANLIPNIVEIVKGYAKHEKEIQKIIAQSRREIIFSKSPPKEREKMTIPSLVAAIENYPDLRASKNFQSLMRTLVDTEERIAYSGEFYNRTVRKYNTLIEQIPFSFVALLSGQKKMNFIAIAKKERVVPEIAKN